MQWLCLGGKRRCVSLCCGMSLVLGMPVCGHRASADSLSVAGGVANELKGPACCGAQGVLPGTAAVNYAVLSAQGFCCGRCPAQPQQS